VDRLTLAGGEIDGTALDPFLDVEGRGSIAEFGAQGGGCEQGGQREEKKKGQRFHGVRRGYGTRASSVAVWQSQRKSRERPRSRPNLVVDGPFHSVIILPSTMSHTRLLLSLLLVLIGCRVVADVVLNEFMARNVTGLTDNKQAYSDWIELRNTGVDPVDIGGWYLTDTPTNKTAWQIPAYTIPAGGYYVIFASAKNQTLVPSGLHTNFRLSSKGGYLALVRPDGVTVASEFKDYPEQFADVSYGLSSDQAGPPVYLNAPTPRATNSPGFPSRAGKVTYSQAGGLIVDPFDVTLTSTHPTGSRPDRGLTPLRGSPPGG